MKDSKDKVELTTPPPLPVSPIAYLIGGQHVEKRLKVYFTHTLFYHDNHTKITGRRGDEGGGGEGGWVNH